MSLYIPKMSDTPAITIPGLASNFAQIDDRLMDYEEGTWTPFLGDIDATYSEQRGYYLRVANMVFLEMAMFIDTKAQGPSVHARISGLPFRSPRNGGYFIFRPLGGFTLQSGKIPFLQVVSGESAYLYQCNPDGSGLASITTGNIPNGGGLRVIFSYSI